jgi:hypothetical protein
MHKGGGHSDDRVQTRKLCIWARTLPAIASVVRRLRIHARYDLSPAVPAFASLPGGMDPC